MGSKDQESTYSKAIKNEHHNFKLKIKGKIIISIYKPLIPLKMMLFLFYGGGSFLGPFVTVYLKQRGLSLGEISAVFIVAPVAQFFGTLVSGIVADKMGRSKPVLICNFILTVLVLISILLIPPIKNLNCDAQPINFKCIPNQFRFSRLVTKTSCDVLSDTIKVKTCEVHCPGNITESCNDNNLICDILAGKEKTRSFSLAIQVDGFSKVNDRCYYNISDMSHENRTCSWCHVPHKKYCKVSCSLDSRVKCSEEIGDRNKYLWYAVVLYVLLMVTFSNCYRFMDVTTMALVKEHDSDYGKERFFSVVGILVISPIAGFLVTVTSTIEGSKNYNSAFYFFIALSVLLVVISCYMDIRLNSPGRKMMKKAIYLLKNADFISFAVVVLVLGAAFSFKRNFMFWYLDEMKAPSILMGLVPAVSALYGLPFLFTSDWWVRKLGATRIFLLGFTGYVITCVGYSYLQDPWISLCLEGTSVLTYHLLWVAVISYSHELAPEGLSASVISIAGSLHYHIGQSIGSLTGGLIMGAFDGRLAFRVVAAICFVSALLYSTYLVIKSKCYDNKLVMENDDREDSTNTAKSDETTVREEV